MPAPTPIGTETQVNTDLASSYAKATTLGLSNGNFFVFWAAKDGQVKGQLFNADGVKSGEEFSVSGATEEWARDINAVQLSNGKIALTWAGMDDTASDTDNGSIQGRIINADGTPAGDLFTANTTTTGRQEYANVSATGNGGFFITWTDNTVVNNAAAYDIRGQFFNASGEKVGGEIAVATTTGGTQRFSEMAKLQNGNVVVTWTDEGKSADEPTVTVRAQIFAPNGTKVGAEFIVPTELAAREYWPDVVGLSNGKFLIVWNDNGGKVPGQGPNGTITDSDISGAVGQIFNADGTKSGDDFLLNTQTAGAQNWPKVTALNDGGFVAVWHDYTGQNITAQSFNADGTKRGEAITVNTVTDGTQEEPQITVLPSGRIVIVWEDNSTGVSVVKMQVLDSGTGPDVVEPEGLNLKGTVGADVLRGAAGDDTIKGMKGNDKLLGAAGDDLVYSGKGNDRMQGGAGNDSLQGEDGNDRLIGNDGNDRLVGAAGKDFLKGGLGQDFLAGGVGADKFVFGSAAEAEGDQIRDFQHGIDKINFAAFMDGGKFIGAKAFAANDKAQVQYVKATGVLSVDLDGDGDADFSLTVLNKAVLTASDFIL